jgi:hypothetical protein
VRRTPLAAAALLLCGLPAAPRAGPRRPCAPSWWNGPRLPAPAVTPPAAGRTGLPRRRTPRLLCPAARGWPRRGVRRAAAGRARSARDASPDDAAASVEAPQGGRAAQDKRGGAPGRCRSHARVGRPACDGDGWRSARQPERRGPAGRSGHGLALALGARTAPRRGAGGSGAAKPPRYGRKLHATVVTGRGHLRRPRGAGAARVRLWPAMADGLARPLHAAQPRMWNSEERSQGVSAPAPACVPVCGSRPWRDPPGEHRRPRGAVRRGGKRHRPRPGDRRRTVLRACLRQSVGAAFTRAGGTSRGPLSIGPRPSWQDPMHHFAGGGGGCGSLMRGETRRR